MAASTSDNGPGSTGTRGSSVPWWRRLLFGPGHRDAVPAVVPTPPEEPPLGVPDSVLDPDSVRDAGNHGGADDNGDPGDRAGQWYESDIRTPATAAIPAAATGATPQGDQAPAADAPDPTPGGRRLSNRAVLAGSVSAGPDTPVADAVLVVLDPTGAEVTRGRSDAGGRYELTLPTGGTYLVAVSTQGHRPSIASVTVAADRVDRDFTVSAISALGGVVRTADGRGCPGASVTLIDAGGDVAAVARTDADGGYELTDLYPGDYTLTAIVPDAGTTARPVRLSGSDRTVADIDLPATGTVLGVVTRQGSDQPVADAQVAVLDAAGLPAASTVTGADGGFRIDDLPSGSYTVVASGYAPSARPVGVQAGPGEPIDLAIGHQADTTALPRGRHARTDGDTGAATSTAGAGVTTAAGTPTSAGGASPVGSR